MTTHNHRQRAFWQTTRHFNIARRVRTVIAVVIVPHVGSGDNDVRLFIHLQFLNHHLRLFGRFTELDIGEEFRVTDLRGVVRRQSEDGDFQILAFKNSPGLEQAFSGTLLVDIGGEEGEFGPLFLLTQHAERIIKLMITDGHRIVANQVHTTKVRFRVLQVGFRYASVNVAAGKQQHAAAFSRDLFANAVHQRFLRR